MTDDRNPQREQMADESMVRNLAAQAEAIWPQERALVERYGLSGALDILDAGCGTGEFSRRIAELFPQARVLGVDVLDTSLRIAETACAPLGHRVRFENRSIYSLGLETGSFDLTVCRHVLQSIPHPDDALLELSRVTRRGGRLHLICEDYGMIHFPVRTLPSGQAIDPNHFWYKGPQEFGAATNCDLHIGRNAYGHLRRLGLRDIRIDYVTVDPLRVPRETFAAIFTAWRDGYADIVSANSSITRGEFVAHFEGMLETLADPDGYGVWQVPVVSAVVP